MRYRFGNNLNNAFKDLLRNYFASGKLKSSDDAGAGFLWGGPDANDASRDYGAANTLDQYPTADNASGEAQTLTYDRRPHSGKVYAVFRPECGLSLNLCVFEPQNRFPLFAENALRTIWRR